MFWKRSKRSPQVAEVARIFGEDVARTCEAYEQSPGQQDIAHLYFAATGVAQRFNKHRSAVVTRLYAELQQLSQAYPTDRDIAFVGYGALISALDKGILDALDDGLFLEIGERLYDRAPLHSWSPVKEWRQQLPNMMQPEARMWAWHHLVSCFCLNINGFKDTLESHRELADDMMNPQFRKILMNLRISAYRLGWMNYFNEKKYLTPAQQSACEGLETLYQCFDGGRCIGFHEEILAASEGGIVRNHIRSINDVLTARGDIDNIPRLIKLQLADGPDFTVLMALQMLIEINLIGASSMGNESAGIDLDRYQREVIMKEPLIVLLQNPK